MRNIYEGKIVATCKATSGISGCRVLPCSCTLPEGHTGDHRCQFCEWNWINLRPTQALLAVTPDELALKEQDERWLEAMGWTDLVQKGPYTQTDRQRYVKLFAESLQKEQAKSNAAGLGAFLIASLEEEKAQRKANFVAWQTACATISRLLAEVAELKKALSDAREGHLLRQLRWKL